MTKHLYMLRDLKATRALEAGDDLSDLDFMKEVGPHEMTPLVIEGNTIIDGVRRFHMAQQLGWDYLYAIRPEDVYEASEALALNHATPLRRWEHVVELVEYLRRMNRIRVTYRRRNPGSTEALVPLRDLTIKALGGLRPTQFEKAPLVKGGDAMLWQKCLNGEATPASAYATYMKRGTGKNRDGGIVDPVEQLEVYQRSLRQFHMITESLKKIGETTITKENARGILTEFKSARNTLNILLRRLEEAYRNDR